jgi:hypothetical protein
MVNAVNVPRFFLQADGNIHHALPVNTQFNSTNGADCRTGSAEVAFLFAPEDAPGKILRA